MYLLARATRDAITRWCMAWRSRPRTRRIEDTRKYPDVWITVTKNDLSVITQLADRWTDRWRTAQRCLASARHFELSTCSVWGTWCTCSLRPLLAFLVSAGLISLCAHHRQQVVGATKFNLFMILSRWTQVKEGQEEGEEEEEEGSQGRREQWRGRSTKTCCWYLCWGDAWGEGGRE